MQTPEINEAKTVKGSFKAAVEYGIDLFKILFYITLPVAAYLYMSYICLCREHPFLIDHPEFYLEALKSFFF